MILASFGLQRERKIDVIYMLLIYAIDKQAYGIMKNLGKILSNLILSSTRVPASSPTGLVLCDARIPVTQIIMWTMFLPLKVHIHVYNVFC